MKTIKTPLFTRKIEDYSTETVLFQLRELLSDYRKALIARLILDLPTYVHYRFQMRTDKKQLEDILERLYELKNGSIDLNDYGGVVKEVLANDSTYISAAPFYHEIDRNIALFVKEAKMTLL